MSFEFVGPVSQSPAVIKVIGVGGGGGNAVLHMLAADIKGVDFVGANTDAQDLQKFPQAGAPLLQLGAGVTKGLGAGTDPEIGRRAALEDKDRIKEVLEGVDMVFIAAGMGGGTGTGAAPIFAQIAKDLGVLTVAVVTRPFKAEGAARARVADEGISELGQFVDSLITIPNDKLQAVLGREVRLSNAFSAANDVLLGAVQGIAEIITRPGVINVDFADVKTVMSESGMAMMGTGKANGNDRAQSAAEMAVCSPLTEEVNLSGAKGVLVNVTCGEDFLMDEYNQIAETVGKFAAVDATMVIGVVMDPELSGDIRVTIVATGLGRGRQSQRGNRLRLVQPGGENWPLNYGDFERPTVIRDGKNAPAAPPSSEPEQDCDHDPAAGKEAERKNSGGSKKWDPEQDHDIPAFLRRQSD